MDCNQELCQWFYFLHNLWTLKEKIRKEKLGFILNTQTYLLKSNKLLYHLAGHKNYLQVYLQD